MIVDSHVHIFPFIDGARGLPSQADHLRALQLLMCGHPNPVRRLRDRQIVEGKRPGSGPLLGPQDLPEVGFRAGRHGRFEWTVDGEDYYLSFFPPSLQCPRPDWMEVKGRIEWRR